MSTICKEQCFTTKSTVQERVIECPTKDLCEGGAVEKKDEVEIENKAEEFDEKEGKPEDSCDKKRIQLAECLKTCLLEAGQKAASAAKQ